MDEFDNDFEFRPITEGLGFHRKVKSIRDEIDGANLAREELAAQIPNSGRVNIEAEKEKTLNDLINSIGSKIDFVPTQNTGVSSSGHGSLAGAASKLTAAGAAIATGTTGSSISNNKQKPAAKNVAASMATELPREMHLCPISFSFSAMIFDAIMAFALSLLFLIALVVATDMDLPRLIQASTMYVTNQIGLVVLYIAVAQLYVISARAFAGQTLGEWAFDVQLGTFEDQRQATFPLLVFARALLVTLTGVFILPLIALVFGVDYAARILSLRLYRAE